MDEENQSPKNDHLVHRMNQVLSGIVACAVLGVGGLMAYQNRESLKAPDAKDSFLGRFLNKKFATATAFPQTNLPEFKAPDWENYKPIDPSQLGIGQGIQLSSGQLSNTSHSSSHRRRP